MALTLESSITELILEIGNILNSPEQNTNVFELEIPNQSFFLEIIVKPKSIKKDKTSPYFVKRSLVDEHLIFERDNNYHKQKAIEKKNPIFKQKSKKNF